MEYIESENLLKVTVARCKVSFRARARHVSILASVFSGLLKFRAIETGYACSVWAKRSPMDTD